MYRKVRPMPHEKTSRNQELRELHQKNPNLTLRDLGRLYGVSASRVLAIIRRPQ